MRVTPEIDDPDLPADEPARKEPPRPGREPVEEPPPDPVNQPDGVGEPEKIEDDLDPAENPVSEPIEDQPSGKPVQEDW